MLIGHGDLVKALKELDRDDLLFFASGVSNSQETRESEYQREIDLLLKQDRSLHIVYFSSLCIFYSDSRYSFHKKLMEAKVEEHFDHYTIIRLGNITWGDNPHTLINFLRNKKKNNEPLDIQDTYRYLVDREEFSHWIKMIPLWNCEINIPGRRLKVADIVKEYV